MTDLGTGYSVSNSLQVKRSLKQQDSCSRDTFRNQRSINKRRSSSFTSTSSPWFRRNSLLSPAMVQNENISVYDSPNYYSHSSSYNIISLKECQGFIFNQDLFASPYQQQKSLANEKKLRAMSGSKSSSNSVLGSRSASRSCSQSQASSTVNTPSYSRMASPKSQQRRHTSYHDPRPSLLYGTTGDDNAMIDDDDQDDDEDGDEEFVFENTSMELDEIEDHEDVVIDEYEEFELMGEYGDSTNRMYKVHVTEITVNENDNSIFPS